MDALDLARYLLLEPDSGKLFWKARPLSMFGSLRAQRSWNGRYAGREAFTALDAYGYRQGRILDKTYKAHRVIWALAYGEWPDQIDHVNRQRTDNRLCNLRDVSVTENNRNASRHTGNTSGKTGVSHNGHSWVARIGGDYIGSFCSFSDAVAARKAAEMDRGFAGGH